MLFAHQHLGVLSSLILWPSLALSYSFTIDNTPSQCGPLNISIVGSDGTAPYRLTIIPQGGSPLGIEVRKIMDVQFNDSSSLSFTLPYPQFSQFVAVVSDKNGSNFGSGGTTVSVDVQGSGTNSCLPTQQVSPLWTFSQDPLGSLTTCQSGFFLWDPSTVQGDVNFYGVIPGGNSFRVPVSDTTTDPAQTGKTAVTWTPNVLPGVQLTIVAGDSRGVGTGGSGTEILQPGNGTTSCVDSSSPSSTPGSPAGGTYPTNSAGDSTSPSGTSSPGSPGSGSSHKSNAGAIAGGVVGGVAGLIMLGLLVLFFIRRRRHKQAKKDPVDLLDPREAGDDENGNREPPEFYLPEPFRVPDPSVPAMSEISSARGTENVGGPEFLGAHSRRESGISLGSQGRVSTEGPISSSSRKTPAGPPQLRPINIIQHDDAGPSAGAAAEEEAETVELPPAYNNLRK